MMKNLYALLITLILMGCVYDPPTGVVNIKNSSSEVVYVYLTCETTLPEDPELKPYFELGNNVFDSKGNKVENVHYYPNYRIEPDSIGYLSVWGTPNTPEIPCDQPNMYLFFIAECVIREYDWKEIVQRKLYQKRMKITKQQLDRTNWKVEYIH